jgi:hypothetical protein
VTEPSGERTTDRLEALRQESNLVLAEVSQGQQLAATNLLEKAAVALHRGDRDKARAMVLRAQALGHDEHEDVDVCSWSAHMTMFNLVTDVMNESGEEWAWLDAAATVLRAGPEGAVPEAGRQELVDVLVTVSKDYELEHIELVRLRPLIRDALRRPGITDGRVLEVEEVLGVLAAIAAYEDAVDELEGQTGAT